MNDRVEIPRRDWRTYLAWVTRSMRGSRGTIEVLDPDGGERIIDNRAPVRAISHDGEADAIVIVMGPMGRPGPTRHFVGRPVRLLVERQTGPLPTALLVESFGGGRTLLRLTAEPALPGPAGGSAAPSQATSALVSRP